MDNYLNTDKVKYPTTASGSTSEKNPCPYDPNTHDCSRLISCDSCWSGPKLNPDYHKQPENDLIESTAKLMYEIAQRANEGEGFPDTWNQLKWEYQSMWKQEVRSLFRHLDGQGVMQIDREALEAGKTLYTDVLKRLPGVES